MKYYLHLFAFLFLCAFAKAQSKTDAVVLVEEKLSKRWNLYAQNNSDTDHEAFLLVKGSGFRRRANRPVIKMIPAGKKVLMTTLIPLNGENPKYNPIFTFEEKFKAINKKKNDGLRPEDAVNLRPINPKELTIFVEPQCAKCKILTDHLNSKHIKYRILNIKKHDAVRKLLFSTLPPSENHKMIALPALVKNGKVTHSIYSINEFIKTHKF